MSFLAKYSPLVCTGTCLMLDENQQLAFACAITQDWASMLLDDYTMVFSEKDYGDFVSFCAERGFDARPSGEHLN